MGQRDLVKYGIQNEVSHIRAHVCPVAHRIYVYPTRSGLDAIDTKSYRLVAGYQRGVASKTSMGYLVPPFDIKKCVALTVNVAAWRHFNFQNSDDTSVKGHKAEEMIGKMLQHGMFPIPALGDVVEEKDIQLRGGDIFIKPNALRKKEIIIQVKCDFPGGEKELGGTGNLFLQIAESNPLHKY